MTAEIAEIDRVLTYWFGRNAEERATKRKLWFGGGPEVDTEVRTQFGTLVEQARAGELARWAETPRGALAWLILVDQFSRNIYRDRADAFTCDPQALAWTRANLAKFSNLSAAEQMFALLPFEHAEDLEAQKEGMVQLTKLALREGGASDQLKQAIEFGRKHLDVIARFGRFPHRNQVLGRTSTPEELEYLAYGKQVGQWL